MAIWLRNGGFDFGRFALYMDDCRAGVAMLTVCCVPKIDRACSEEWERKTSHNLTWHEA